MKKSILAPCSLLLATLVLLTGCKTGYQWTSKVPAEYRTVSVPTFRNGSDVTELGTITTRQVLREFQREGTFKIRPVGEAAVEIQGEVVSTSLDFLAGDTRAGQRVSTYDFSLVARVSVVDKKLGRVLIDGKVYRVSVPVAVRGDAHTAQRDASGRLADALSRDIVDDVVGMQW